MRNVTLPHTDLSVSSLCLGTMTFGAQTEESVARRMVDYSLDQGVNFFDTANVYNQGVSEEILGRALGKRRSKVVLASKVRMKMPEYQGLSREVMIRALDESLQRLGVDYLDIYYLHAPDNDVRIEESLEALESFRQAGKIRYGAASNYASWQMLEMRNLAAAQGWPEIHISQPMYNVLTRAIDAEYVPFAKEYEVALVCYNPLAGGILTGKQEHAQGPLAGTRFDGNEQYLKRYWREEYFQAMQLLRQASSDRGRSLVEIAFRWLLDQSHVDSVILGASRMEHLEANITAAETEPLSEELRWVCDEAWALVRGAVPQYNR